MTTLIMPRFTPPDFAPPESLRVHDWLVGDAPLDFGKPLAAAMGNFDGVHRGHAALIGAAAEAGKSGELLPAVITFAPHPRRFFAPDSPGFLLADGEDKLAHLAGAGAQIIIRLGFDEALRQTSAADFINTILPAIGLGKGSALVAGEDFSFGHDRKGNLAMLNESNTGITAAPQKLLCDEDGEAISSSRIRDALKAGDMEAANTLLGRPFTISGEVVAGDRIGRTIGFPTANMEMGEMQHPRHGVYVSAVRAAAGRRSRPRAAITSEPTGRVYAGVTHIGSRPGFTDRGVLCETHLFDFEGDLYGKRLNVMLLHHIRDEAVMDGLAALQAHIERDVAIARDHHAVHTGLAR